MKCACAMTTPELLASSVAGKTNLKAVLIEDTGKGWKVTEYSPDGAGLGSEFVTLQATETEVESILVRMRRSTTEADDPRKGTIITDANEIAEALGAKA